MYIYSYVYIEGRSPSQKMKRETFVSATRWNVGRGKGVDKKTKEMEDILTYTQDAHEILVNEAHIREKATGRDFSILSLLIRSKIEMYLYLHTGRKQHIKFE